MAGGGSSWGHGSGAGGGCHHAALVTSVTSLPASRPQVLGCPRAVGGGEAGCGRPGHCGRSLRRAHGRGHGSISFRSDTAQRAARPSPGRTGTGSCCLLCPEPSLVCPVCLSVCPAASPRTFPSGRSACQRLHQPFSCIPPAAHRTSGFADALLVFLESPKCFRNVSSFFLNNSGDRGLPSALMSLSI